MRAGQFEFEIPDPPVKSPHCIAMLRPWVDVGNVGNTVLGRLARLHNATEIGALDRPGMFYDFTRYRPEIRFVNGKRTVRVPNTRVLVGRAVAASEASKDLILLYMMEPHMNGEDYNDSVLELLRALNVERYVLIGGMYDSVPHSRPLSVTGSARGWTPPEEFGDVRLGRSNYQGPTSITSQLADRARVDLGLETLSLIVHLPLYLKLEDDYNGAYRILQMLSSLYGLSADVPERALAEQQYNQLTPAILNNPQLQELVTKFEADYDRDTGEQKESQPDEAANDSVELPPEIEKFLDDVARRGPDSGEGGPNSGGL
jgi:hypothetical protein